MPKEMSKEERREYMRDYRARRKAGNEQAHDGVLELKGVQEVTAALNSRIAELEEEIRKLKRELSRAKVPLHQISEPLVHAVGKVVDVKPPDEPDRPRADRLSKSYFARKKGDKA